MKRRIVTTGDGSKTIKIDEWNEQYHSMHGAVNEARHVFIKHGLAYCANLLKTSEVAVLEIGFGTGLNAFLTLLEADNLKLKIDYSGIEAYPVASQEWQALNYFQQVGGAQSLFKTMHEVNWGRPQVITSNFTLTKYQIFFHQLNFTNQFHLIYFDAFGARVQPDLWTEAIFELMYKALKSNGILVTYSAKGSVRRAMQAVGFKVEKLPGPPGKREMLRATK